MASNMAHLAHLEPWYAQWLEPAHYEVYRGELDAALATVRRAEEQLERETHFSEDERQVLRYELAWTPFNFLSFIGEHEAIEPAFARAQAVLTPEPPGSLSAPTRAFYLISLAGKGVTFGLVNPNPRQLRLLLDTIPADRFVIGAWIHLATVGFYCGESELVEEAFGELLTGTTGLRDGYGWLRVNLMYLLTQQRAQFEDFRQLLASIQHLGELLSFKRDFLLPAEQLGLRQRIVEIVEPLELELRAKLEPPLIEPTTRRVVRR